MNIFRRAIVAARPFLLQRSAMSSHAKRSLEGKVAVVTASTDGIGLEIARRLGQDGAHVVISSRKEANVKKALTDLKDLSVTGIVCHVGNESDRKALLEHAVNWKGGIDILVSNAAVNPHFGSILDTPEQAWDKIFEINVKAAFLLTKAVVPYMEKRGGGSIVYISSIGGIQPFNLLGAYSVSKTALLGLTKAMAPQCAHSNIRVNCVCPGVVQTKFSGAMWKDESIKEKVCENIPLGRLAQPKEMGGMVSFLCSDDASYITGENFVVAGGMQSRL